MNTAIPKVQSKSDICYWNKGKRPEEQGWTINNIQLTLKDLSSVRSFVELQNKGVPSSICEDAKKKGYCPYDIDTYFDDEGF